MGVVGGKECLSLLLLVRWLLGDYVEQIKTSICTFAYILCVDVFVSHQANLVIQKPIKIKYFQNFDSDY